MLLQFTDAGFYGFRSNKHPYKPCVICRLIHTWITWAYMLYYVQTGQCGLRPGLPRYVNVRPKAIVPNGRTYIAS